MTDRLAEVGDEVQVRLLEDEVILTRDAVMSVVTDVATTHPDHVGMAYFKSFVLAEMEERGLIPKEIIPDDLRISPDVLVKMAALGQRGREAEIFAYAILNSATKAQFKKKLEADFGDSIESLHSLFKSLIGLDPLTMGKVKAGLGELEIVKLLPDILGKYFLAWSPQPQMIHFKFAYPEVDLELARELFKNAIPTMLRILKEYLTV